MFDGCPRPGSSISRTSQRIPLPLEGDGAVINMSHRQPEQNCDETLRRHDVRKIFVVTNHALGDISRNLPDL